MRAADNYHREMELCKTRPFGGVVVKKLGVTYLAAVCPE